MKVIKIACEGDIEEVVAAWKRGEGVGYEVVNPKMFDLVWKILEEDCKR